jgi:hypothetical protein
MRWRLLNMKINHRADYPTVATLVALAVALSTTAAAFAADASHLDLANRKLSKVAPPELPARTAKLIAHSKIKEQKSMAIAAVEVAVRHNRVGAPFIVSAVAREVPAVAATVAATALRLEPGQAGLIAKAAAGGAPPQAGEIVAAMCSELPAAYRIIAIGASEAAPRATQEIVAALGRAKPELKKFLDMASQQELPPDGYASPLVGIIQRAEAIGAQSTATGPGRAGGAPLPLVSGPTPPLGAFTPGAGTPGETNRPHPVVVQPGQGRQYSGP